MNSQTLIQHGKSMSIQCASSSLSLIRPLIREPLLKIASLSYFQHYKHRKNIICVVNGRTLKISETRRAYVKLPTLIHGYVRAIISHPTACIVRRVNALRILFTGAKRGDQKKYHPNQKKQYYNLSKKIFFFSSTSFFIHRSSLFRFLCVYLAPEYLSPRL